MNYKKLSTDIIKVWRIHRIISIIIVGIFLLLSFIADLQFLFMKHSALGIGIGTLLKFVLAAIFVYKFIALFVFPQIEYKQWKYLIDNEKILIEHGIFWIRTIVIPISRIQHVTLKKCLIMARYRLQSIDISLASGSFEIPGIKEEQAGLLIDQINALVNMKSIKEEIMEV